MRVQRQIWAHCHRFLTDDRQQLIDCEAPIAEGEARTILASYLDSRETIRSLRFWMTDLSATSNLAQLHKLEAEGLAKRVAKETR
jgi:precorrin-2 methylase